MCIFAILHQRTSVGLWCFIKKDPFAYDDGEWPSCLAPPLLKTRCTMFRGVKIKDTVRMLAISCSSVSQTLYGQHTHVSFHLAKLLIMDKILYHVAFWIFRIIITLLVLWQLLIIILICLAFKNICYNLNH